MPAPARTPDTIADALRYYGDKLDLRKRLERTLSLDPQEGDLGDTAVDIAGGFIPGISQALAVRDIERARRANDPTGMALASTGLIPGGKLADMLKKRGPMMREIGAYHGTAGDFEKFDPLMGGSATGAGSARAATWFVDKPEVAKGYAVHAAEDAPIHRKLAEADKLERIAQRSNKDSDWDKYNQAVQEAEELEKTAYDRRIANAKLLHVDIPDETQFLTVDAKGKTPQELSAQGNIDSWLQQQIAAAKKAGKQGVQIKNLDDAAGLSDTPATHYAVFDPSGVKIISKKKLIEK